MRKQPGRGERELCFLMSTGEKPVLGLTVIKRRGEFVPEIILDGVKFQLGQP